MKQDPKYETSGNGTSDKTKTNSMTLKEKITLDEHERHLAICVSSFMQATYPPEKRIWQMSIQFHRKKIKEYETQIDAGDAGPDHAPRDSPEG
jgi:hypothetical protein